MHDHDFAYEVRLVSGTTTIETFVTTDSDRLSRKLQEWRDDSMNRGLSLIVFTWWNGERSTFQQEWI